MTDVTYERAVGEKGYIEFVDKNRTVSEHTVHIGH